jgi:hypothetical protein
MAQEFASHEDKIKANIGNIQSNYTWFSALFRRVLGLGVLILGGHVTGHSLGCRLLELFSLWYGGLFFGLGFLLVIAISEAEWVILRHGRRLNGRQGLPFA